jgi:hypothetical protein
MMWSAGPDQILAGHIFWNHGWFNTSARHRYVCGGGEYSSGGCTDFALE